MHVDFSFNISSEFLLRLFLTNAEPAIIAGSATIANFVLWQALITTASGLAIAILSVFPYNYFNSRVAKAALRIEKYATSLEIVYEKLQQEGMDLHTDTNWNE